MTNTDNFYLDEREVGTTKNKALGFSTSEDLTHACASLDNLAKEVEITYQIVDPQGELSNVAVVLINVLPTSKSPIALTISASGTAVREDILVMTIHCRQCMDLLLQPFPSLCRELILKAKLSLQRSSLFPVVVNSLNPMESRKLLELQFLVTSPSST